MISALETKRLLLKGCESYLAHVVDTLVTEIKLENVPVVCEFSDFFQMICQDYHQIEN